MLKFRMRLRTGGGLKKKLSYVKQITLIFSTLIVSVLIFALMMGRSQWQEISRSNDEVYIRTAVNYRMALEDHLYFLERKLGEVAKLTAEKDLLTRLLTNKSDVLSHELLKGMDMIPGVSALVLSDSTGRIFRLPYIPSTDESMKDFDLQERDWFIKGASGSSDVGYSMLYSDYLTGEKIITISTLAKQESENQTVVAFDISINQFIAFPGDKLSHEDNAKIYVIMADGTLIHKDENSWRPVSREILGKMSGKNGAVYDEENNRRLYYSNLYYPSLKVLIECDESVINQNIFRESFRVFLMMLSAVVVIVFFWWYLKTAIQTFYLRIVASLRAKDSGTYSIDEMLEKEIAANAQELLDYETAARTDGLTGVLNRHAFDMDITSLTQKKDARMPIALLDIDDFKRINDKWGHQTGDEVLKFFAAMSQEMLAPRGAEVYRFGGEEFAIVFHVGTITAAAEMLNRLRETLAERKWRENDLRVTFSGGLKMWQDEAITDFLASVDSCLYQAKRNGKNQLVIFNDTKQES